MNNEITVVVCAYNCISYFEKTFRSIENQIFRKFDLLVIDDCSIDGSSDLIQNLLLKSNITSRYIRFSENKGIAYARNLALHEAKTKFMLFIDADDLAKNALLEKEYRVIISDPNIIAVSCWSEYIDKDNRKLGGGLYLGPKNEQDFVEKASKGKLMFLPIQTMFDREIAISVGGFLIDGFPSGRPRYQDFCEDLDLWTRMSDLYVVGKLMLSIPEVLYSYRKGSGLSNSSFLMNLKMRFVKSNLLLRRAGYSGMIFSDFLNSLGDKEVRKLKKLSSAGDLLRNGLFKLRKGNLIVAIWFIMRAIVAHPSYVSQKIRKNTRLFK